MLRAVEEKDESFEGVFFLGVKTTGIFCRPGCPARQPKPENISFFASASEALVAGFRPCKKCHPLHRLGTIPPDIENLMDEVLEDPSRKWRDYELQQRGLKPDRVRRWFQANHGMTFHAYCRAARVGAAMGRMRSGKSATSTAFESGFDSVSGFNEAFRLITGVSPRQSVSSVMVKIKRVTSPLGILLVGATDEAVVLLEFGDRRMLATQLKTLTKRFSCPVVPGSNSLIEQMEAELTAYFAGDLQTFETPVEFPGTDFQVETWNALRSIPYGETRSYQDIARQLGRENSVRAVANANGANRIAIVIPCHRVIGSDGSLTGYGGGLWRKQRLLELEGALVPEPDLFD
ncbi:MAG: methylated-DNA--[protein]-cysteine S-methyltransferase [Rhodothermales bacterium]|nr:methylated-DNA--[protein]-cysteine S-methyltransferase [Rhodothermales bacterium]